MHKLNGSLDISSLPALAQSELVDYFEFLQQKYRSTNRHEKNGNDRTRFREFLAQPIKVKKITKYSRDSIHER